MNRYSLTAAKRAEQRKVQSDLDAYDGAVERLPYCCKPDEKPTVHTWRTKARRQYNVPVKDQRW